VDEVLHVPHGPKDHRRVDEVGGRFAGDVRVQADHIVEGERAFKTGANTGVQDGDAAVHTNVGVGSGVEFQVEEEFERKHIRQHFVIVTPGPMSGKVLFDPGTKAVNHEELGATRVRRRVEKVFWKWAPEDTLLCLVFRAHAMVLFGEDLVYNLFIFIKKTCGKHDRTL
jgi:hypothetical protein